MAIRTSRSVSPSASSSRTLPAFLMVRAWPGLSSWLLSVFASSVILAALSAFAWHGETSRLPDFTVSLVTIPVGVLAVILGIALLWRMLAQIPLASGLTFLARLLPFSWIVPIIDILRSGGSGFVFTGIPFDAPHYLLAVFTATLFPVEISIPIALRAGIVAMTLVAAFVVWFSRRALIRSVVMGVITSAALVKAVFFPVAIGLWQGLLRGEGFVTGVGSLSREATIAVTNGYWWMNIYERFPTAVDTQAAAALRLATAAYMVFALGILLLILLLWFVPSVKKILSHGFRSWSSLHAFVYVVGGAIASVAFGATAAQFQRNWWVAFMVALLLMAALRLHFVLERCLFGADSLEGCLPAALGRDLSFAAGAYALVAAWVLGWPVFLAILAALAASALSRHSLWSDWSWAATVFRSAGAASLALAGFFFASQDARLAISAIGIALIAALYQAGAEIFVRKSPKS